MSTRPILIVTVVTALAAVAFVLVRAQHHQGPDERSMGVSTGLAPLPCRHGRAGVMPTADDLRNAQLIRGTVCEWSSAPGTYVNQTSPAALTSTRELGPDQIQQLVSSMLSAPPGARTCRMIDSPPPTTYVVLLDPGRGQVWSVDVSRPSCLGFELRGGVPRDSTQVLHLLSSSG